VKALYGVQSNTFLCGGQWGMILLGLHLMNSCPSGLSSTNKDKGEVHIVGQINDFEGPLQFSPTKRRLHSSIRNFPSTAPIDLDPFIDPTQPTQCTNELATVHKKVHRKVTDDVLSDSSYDSELAASSNSELDAFFDSDS